MAPAASKPSHSNPEELDRVLQFVAVYVLFRAKRRREVQSSKYEANKARSRRRAIERLLRVNALTISAVAVHAFGAVPRQRWRFPRNSRWFEDTLPHLGEGNFKRFFRVSQATYRYIMDACRADLQRQDTVMTDAISVEKRVGIALFRLCSTAEDRTIGELFGVGRSTVNMIYKDFCAAVLHNLAEEWLTMVPPAEMGKHIREFFAMTGFPQGFGALDGCHFPVSPLKDQASDYHNYKGWYSIILLALVDHHYCFRYISIGSPGLCHDSYVYNRSNLCTLIESDLFSGPTALIEGVQVPPIILCDQAFALSANLQKPYAKALPGTPEGAYNYNLSKTRRIVENAFGHLKARFRFTLKRMECTIPTATMVINACCVLHNVCEGLRDQIELQWEHKRGAATDGQYEQPRHTTQAEASNGRAVRAALAQYFVKENQ